MLLFYWVQVWGFKFTHDFNILFSMSHRSNSRSSLSWFLRLERQGSYGRTTGDRAKKAQLKHLILLRLSRRKPARSLLQPGRREPIMTEPRILKPRILMIVCWDSVLNLNFSNVIELCWLASWETILSSRETFPRCFNFARPEEKGKTTKMDEKNKRKGSMGKRVQPWSGISLY